MKIHCEISFTELDGDYGPVEGVVVTCSQCRHRIESFGTSKRSVRRCLALMREQCPEGGNNFYFEQ